jgi:phospholipid/cholesterol/gamma-HCH transport system substrate-binding protein/paraquat-inducible protein B
MEESKRYGRLGAFVAVSLCLLAVGVFLLGGRKWMQPTFMFETYFDQSVAGLDVGSPVKFRGVPLGRVVAILTSTATYEQSVPLDKRREYIVVRVAVDLSGQEAAQMKRDAETLAARGLRAQTQLAGITGQQYLALDFMDPKKYVPLPFEWTPRYSYLPSAPSSAGEIVAKAQSFLASLNGADIKALGQGLNTLVGDLDTKLGEIPVTELAKDLRTALMRTNSILAHTDRLMADPSLRQTVEDAAVILARVRRLSQSGELERLVQDLDDTSERLNALVGDNQYDVRATVEDLHATATNLRALSENVKRYPAGFLVGGPPDKIRLPGRSP